MSRPLRLLTTVARVSQTRLNPTLATTHHRWFSDTPQTDAERMKAEFLAKKATREETPEGKLEKAARNAKIAAAEAERRAEEEDGPNPDAPNPDAPNLDATKEDTTTETTTTADATPKEPTDFSSFIPKMDAYTFKQNLLSFNDGVKDAWAELLAGGAKDVNKNIAAPLVPNPETGTASKEEYMGTTALMAVDPDQSAWERMQARMRDSPVIDEVLKAAGKISSATGIKKAGQKLGDIREDAAEAWETSQNPWVYRISSVWDTLTAEHEHALVVAELRRLDADFDLEEWQVAISENVIPGIIKDYMGGKASKVRPWMGDAVYNKVAAEVSPSVKRKWDAMPALRGMR